MKSDNFGKVVNVTFFFFDALVLAYGQCSFIRIVNETGRVHRSLLLEKSKIVPEKFMSILRLEQNAPVLSVKIHIYRKNS